MKLQHVLLCLSVVVSTALSEDNPLLNPRGARPIEHGYKQEKCATEQEWPFCTDDDWGRKCPSGCRIQGLLDSTDHEILKKIEKIRKLLDEGRKMYRSADQVSKDTYTYLRERLLSSSGNDNRYVDLAEQLRQRIVEMKIKIDRQLRVLEALKSQVRNQVIAMQRLEVDIDIKLRSCKGSCASYAEFSVDKESYAALDKQMDRLETMRVQSVETVSSLRVMKSRPMKDVVVPSVYKAGPGGAEQTKPLFSDLGQMKLSLEAEGSTAESAATVSKVPTVCESKKSVNSPKRPSTFGHQRRFEQCPVSKHPMCTDEEEENKCPSGCRLQGLIDKEEEGIYERLSNICDKAERLKGTTSSTMLTSAQFYEAKRKRIVKTYMEELRYAEAAERLHRNLTLLRMKSSQLSSELHRYHSQILEQITELRRLEVDIDIKLRACKGSCKQTFDHTIDHEAFKAMEDNMGRFGLLPMNQNPLTMDKKVKLQSVVRPPVSLSYRKIPLVQAKLLTKFEDIEQNQVVIEELLQDIWTSDEEAKP